MDFVFLPERINFALLKISLRNLFMQKIKNIKIILILACFFCNGCNLKHNMELIRVAELASDYPEAALDSLARIDYSVLSESDRHYYDFLKIKALDKAYITHTSDSLILDVIKYAHNNNCDIPYEEALYYGGRVYGDLGDLPTALKYFEKVLEWIGNSNTKKELLSSVHAQMGYLFNSLRLYDKAIEQVEKSIEIDRQLKDSLNEIYDILTLVNINIRANKYDEASLCLQDGLRKGKQISKDLNIALLLSLVEIKMVKHENEAAINILRPLMKNVNDFAKNQALSLAAMNYYKAGITDTAYMYAHELVNRKDSVNKIFGYTILLSPEVRYLVTQDSLDKYITDYKKILRKEYDKNEAEATMIQHSLYNYQLHEREREKAENAKEKLKNWIDGLLLLLLLVVIVFLIYRNRNKNNIIKLHVALDTVRSLEKMISGGNPTFREISATDKTKDWSEFGEGLTLVDSLREKLKNELLNLNKSLEENKIAINPDMQESEAYKKLRDHLENGEGLREDDSLWRELYKEVLKYSPDFERNLRILTGGKISSFDLHTIILIKFNLTTAQMTEIFNRSKTTIFSRRNSLSKRIFGENISSHDLDNFLRLM